MNSAPGMIGMPSVHRKTLRSGQIPCDHIPVDDYIIHVPGEEITVTGAPSFRSAAETAIADCLKRFLYPGEAWNWWVREREEVGISNFIERVVRRSDGEVRYLDFFTDDEDPAEGPDDNVL